MKNKKYLLFFTVVCFIFFFTFLYGRYHQCIFQLGPDTYLSPGLGWRICVANHHNSDAGQVRWNSNIQLGDYGYLSSIWINNAQVIAFNPREDSTDVYVSYKVGQENRVARLVLYKFANLLTEVEGKTENKGMVTAADVIATVQLHDTVSVGLTYISQRSSLTIEGYQEYLSGVFKEPDLGMRLQNIKYYGAEKISDAKVEDLLSRRYPNLKNSGLLVTTIVEEEQ